MKIHDFNFMEKKIKKTSEGTKSVSKSEEKTIIVTIVIALMILSALLVNLVLTPIEKEQFSAIYYLDYKRTLENFPKTVILDQNNTFLLWVGVENRNNKTMEYSVQIKIDDAKSPVNPSNSNVIDWTNKTLVSEEVWEFPATLFIDTPGINRIIFELHYFNGTRWAYTGSWVTFSIEALKP